MLLKNKKIPKVKFFKKIINMNHKIKKKIVKQFLLTIQILNIIKINKIKINNKKNKV
jgi:hypothetical protein